MMQPHATPAADWIVVLPVLVPLIGAALLILLRGAPRRAAVAAGVVAAAAAEPCRSRRASPRWHMPHTVSTRQ